jgi:hypothetical protein
MLPSAVGVRWRCAFIKENSLASSPFLRFDDLAAVLAMSACERAAGAIATAVTELTESGAATDQMTAVLLKHFLVHFSSLENDFEQLIQPMSFEDADLAPARSEQP